MCRDITSSNSQNGATDAAARIGAVRAADDLVQTLIEKVKADTEIQFGKKFETFRAIEYASISNTGAHYFIKVDVGAQQCVHLRIYRHQSGDVSLSSALGGLKLEDPVRYFDPPPRATCGAYY